VNIFYPLCLDMFLDLVVHVYGRAIFLFRYFYIAKINSFGPFWIKGLYKGLFRRVTGCETLRRILLVIAVADL